jgi:hypothetical protein
MRNAAHIPMPRVRVLEQQHAVLRAPTSRAAIAASASAAVRCCRAAAPAAAAAAGPLSAARAAHMLAASSALGAKAMPSSA